MGELGGETICLKFCVLSLKLPPLFQESNDSAVTPGLVTSVAQHVTYF